MSVLCEKSFSKKDKTNAGVLGEMWITWQTSLLNCSKWEGGVVGWCDGAG